MKNPLNEGHSEGSQIPARVTVRISNPSVACSNHAVGTCRIRGLLRCVHRAPIERAQPSQFHRGRSVPGSRGLRNQSAGNPPASRADRDEPDADERDEKERWLPSQAASLPQAHNLRSGRERSELASSSLTNSNRAGSKVRGRPRIHENDAAKQAMCECSITSGLVIVG
jgi:hypothetical protein